MCLWDGVDCDDENILKDEKRNAFYDEEKAKQFTGTLLQRKVLANVHLYQTSGTPIIFNKHIMVDLNDHFDHFHQKTLGMSFVIFHLFLKMTDYKKCYRDNF